jgi:hypothetical protein
MVRGLELRDAAETEEVFRQLGSLMIETEGRRDGRRVALADGSPTIGDRQLTMSASTM